MHNNPGKFGVAWFTGLGIHFSEVTVDYEGPSTVSISTSEYQIVTAEEETVTEWPDIKWIDSNETQKWMVVYDENPTASPEENLIKYVLFNPPDNIEGPCNIGTTTLTFGLSLAVNEGNVAVTWINSDSGYYPYTEDFFLEYWEMPISELGCSP